MYSKSKYTITSAVDLTPEVRQLTLKPQNGERFNFLPGQHITISCNVRGVMLAERPFTITNSPSEKSVLQISFKKFGEYTHDLASLLTGDEVEVGGPYGSFVLDAKFNNITMIAGGIGITPFISMCRFATQNKLPNKLTLIYSGRKISNTPFIDELVDMQKGNSSLKCFIHLTEESNLHITEFTKNARITQIDFQRYLYPDLLKNIFYICGPIEFGKIMRGLLISLGVDNSHIMTEEFAISPPTFLPRQKGSVWLTSTMAVFIMLLSLYFIYQTSAKKNNDAITAAPSSSSSSSAPTANITATYTPDPTNTPIPTIKTTVPTPTPTPNYTPQPRTKLS